MYGVCFLGFLVGLVLVSYVGIFGRLLHKHSVHEFVHLMRLIFLDFDFCLR